jgi:hypothetical protein
MLSIVGGNELCGDRLEKQVDLVLVKQVCIQEDRPRRTYNSHYDYSKKKRVNVGVNGIVVAILVQYKRILILFISVPDTY